MEEAACLCHKYCKIPRFDKTVDKHVTVIALKGVIVVVFNRFDKCLIPDKIAHSGIFHEE